MRWMFGFFAACLALWQISPAAACKMMEPTLDSVTQQSELVVVATVTKIEGSQATFSVEAPIKGSLPQNDLDVLNHQINNGADCQPSLGDGERFAEGSRWVLFLVPTTLDPDITWQTASFGDYGALKVEQDQVSYTEQGTPQQIPLPDMVETLSNYASLNPNELVDPLPGGAAAPAVEPQILPAPAPELIDTDPNANPVAQVDVAPTIAPTSAAPSWLPWVLVGVGVVAAIGALIGWQRSRSAKQ
ncbi:hypothetical protein [Herpetosiphon gulosus]|uniref:Uncharacterized protein n=1 Tax=Herpetosiphon gulosus TaxID=1973496 RepID=A0ABP9WTY4_9CHLR